MNPIAEELNREMREASPTAYALLSRLGRELFFPKGILSQSAEAKTKAHRFNATIGTAIEKGEPMHLAVADQYFNLPPEEVYPYAPPAGRPGLRRAWKAKMEQENPSVKGKAISLPIVTSAITHGLSIAADLFLDPGDVILSPDKLWGNYRLTFETLRQAKISTFPLFNEQEGFNVEGFAAKLAEEAAQRSKLVVLLNFPNNPTGYTPTPEEGEKIVELVTERAKQGTHILTLCDDSYFGLFYEDSFKESLFGSFCDAHENILALKLDGATKEYFAWGFRTGFISFGTPSAKANQLYQGFEKKVMGCIRGNISNCNHAAQSVVERMFDQADFAANRAEKHEIMKARALKVKEVLNTAPYQEELVYYPFNSGYFMCLRFADLQVETLRLHLLEQYGVGTIAIGLSDLRIAFSCIELEDIPALFELILQGVRDLRAKN